MLGSNQCYTPWHKLPRPSTEGDVKPHVRRRCGAGRQGVSSVWSKAWRKAVELHLRWKTHLMAIFLDENLWGIISVIFVFLLVFLLVDVQSSGVTFGKLCENIRRHWHPWNCFSLGWRFDKFPWIMGSPQWCWSQLTHLISSQMMDIFL